MINIVLGFLVEVIFGFFSCVRGGQTEMVETIKIIALLTSLVYVKFIM